MIIVVDDYGVSLGRRNRCFLIEKGEIKRKISPFRVTAIHLRKSCELSSPAVLLAAEHDIPILLFNNKGKVKARLWQPHFGSLAEVRRGQLHWSDQREGLAWACDLLVKKTKGQIKLLNWLSNRIPSQKEQVAEAIREMKAWKKKLAAVPETKKAIRAAEAQCGRLYWEAYFAALKNYEASDKRTRQPAQDPLNALLNYGYGMLYGEVESAVLTAGLDPQIGVLHREKYNKPAFVFDAIEPFRPWVDRLVAKLAIGEEIQHNWFRETEKGIWLQKVGKQVFIPAWYKMLHTATNFHGRRIKRKDQIQYLFAQLAKGFLEEENTKEATP